MTTRLAKWLRSTLLLLAVSVAAVAPAIPAVAQDAGTEDPAESRAMGFRAVSGPDVEQVPGGALMVSAYAVIFLFLLVYVVRLGSLQAGLSRDVRRLEGSLAAAEKAAADKELRAKKPAGGGAQKGVEKAAAGKADKKEPPADEAPAKATKKATEEEGAGESEDAEEPSGDED